MISPAFLAVPCFSELLCFSCISVLVLLILAFHCFLVSPLSFLAFAAGVVLGLFFMPFLLLGFIFPFLVFLSHIASLSQLFSFYGLCCCRF